MVRVLVAWTLWMRMPVSDGESVEPCCGVDFRRWEVGAGERQQSTRGVSRLVADSEARKEGRVSVVQA